MPGPKVTLSGAVPAGELDGVGLFAKDILDSPRQAVLVVGVLSASWTKTNHDKGREYPVLRFRHWEVVAPDNEAAVTEAMIAAYSRRSGQLALPLPIPPGTIVPLDAEGDGDEGEE